MQQNNLQAQAIVIHGCSELKSATNLQNLTKNVFSPLPPDVSSIKEEFLLLFCLFFQQAGSFL